MKKRLKFINIFAILISLLIIFLSFSLNVNADDEITADVYYDFDVEKTDDYTTANVRIIDNENNYTLVEGTDYTISYINNDVVGMAEFSINILNSNYILNEYSYSFNIYDKIIKVYDDYGIDIYNLAIELEDNYASIDSIFSNLLADYGDYVEVTNTEATTSTDIYSQIRVTGDYSVLLIIKGDYGTNDITISEGNAFDFTWHARNIVITEADLNNRLIVTGLENQGYYWGSSQSSTWAGEVKYNNTSLTEETDYTFTVNILDDEEMIHYYNSTESGISSSDADGSVYYGNVTFEFKGNYYGTVTVIYKLCPDIQSFEPYIEGKEYFSGGYQYEYTGEEIIPEFELINRNNDEHLTLDVDFEYVENQDFGVDVLSNGSYYELIVRGIGNYAGTAYIMYQILPIEYDESAIEITGLDNQAYYIGMSRTSYWVGDVLYNDVELEKDVDYTVSEIVIKDKDGNVYEYGSEVGISASNADGKVYYEYTTISFTKNYSGEYTFFHKICPDIANTEIDFNDEGYYESGYAMYEYTGEVIVPDFNLKLTIDSDTVVTLVRGTDFEFEDPTNIDADYYSLDIYGMGDYAGFYNLQYQILPKSMESSDITYEAESTAYYDEASNPHTNLVIELNDETLDYKLILNTDYEISYTYDLDNSIGIATISGIGNYRGSFEVSFALSTKKMSDLNINISYDGTYNDHNCMYYKGTNVYPSIEIKDGDILLEEDVDYKVTFEGNSIDYDGTVNIVIESLNSNYYGNLEYDYIIHSAIFEDIEYTYVGNKNLEYILLRTEKSDLIETYTNIDISDVGAYATTATLKPGYVFKDGDNYSLEGTININIIPQEINDDFDIQFAEANYTGSALEPNVTIIDLEENELILNQDYTIEYKNNINSGTAIATIKGIGNYNNEIDVEFNIAKISSDNLSIDDIPEYVIYDYEEVTLNPTIEDENNNTLIENTDYEISYENNNEIGTASYRIDFIGNYEGSIEGTFRIVETLITEDDSNLRIEGLHDSDYYLGQQATINAALEIYYNDSLLTSDDYDIETIIKDNDGNVHHNNSGGSGINDTDADGTVYIANVIVTFKGQYAGELNYTFDVKPSIETATINVLDDARLDGNTLYYEYNGEVIIPSFNLILGDFTLTYGTDFELSDSSEFNNINKGTYEKILKGINNYGGSFYLFIEIEGKDINSSDIQMEFDPNCYVPIDSNNFLFDITIHDETLNYDLAKYDDFDLNFYLNVDTVTITITGLNNYGSSKEIIVSRANATLTSDIVNITYDTSYNDYNAMYYTGDINHPNVVVSINDTIFVEDEDYKLSYEGDYNFGSKITLKIKGLTHFYGELTYEYIIYSPTFEDIEYPYIGNKSIDYLLMRSELSEYFENVSEINLGDVGTYSTTATLKPGYVFKDGDNYSLEGTININIIPQEVSNDFDISYDELIYNGKELTPSLKIIDFEENELILNQDYKLSYTNNIEVGSMLLKIEGIGNYNGVIEDYPIEILPRSLNADYIKYETSKNLYYDELDDNYIYYINIYDEEMNYKLVQDVDYNIYSSFDGDKGYIYVEGINNYKEFLEIEVPLAKYLIDENNINIEFDSNDESNNIMYFTGLEVLPNIEIKYDDNLLIEGTDYIVNYEGNFSEYGSLININISGLNDYYISYNSSFILKSTIINEISLQYRGKTTISNLISLSEYKDIFESFDDFEIDFIGAYELSAKVKKGYVIANDNYSLEGIINVLVYTEDAELEMILEEAAEDIIQTATMSSEFDLDSINFEDLTGLSKEELIKAKEYYNDLEKYVIDNGIDVLVNNHLKELGYDVLVSAEEIAVRLKIYLDTYAINVGYTDFNAQVDDAINAMTVEEEKDIVKEELDAFIHRHTKASTMEKLHKVVEEKNEELDSVYYSKYTDDSTRSDYFNELTEKVHEIKNVTIIIVKHTQNQEIANNNIESYYNELVESSKYNEAQLQLLKEVFDEMQQKVEAVLSADNIVDQLAVQDELNKIVNDAILKLTNVEITSVKVDDENGVKASIDASEGMNSKTELNVENADKNVSIKINKAINSNNVKGSDDAILLIKNKDVKEAYNINLMVEGEALEEFKGVYTVKLLLTDELKSYNNLQIIYIASDGSIEVCNTYIDGDYLVFNTTHFSTYYLLGDKLIDFAPYVKILLALIAALIIFIVYLILKIKNKKINQIGLSLSICLLPISAFININIFVVCIILSIIALILLITAILLVIKDYRKDRSLENEE